MKEFEFSKFSQKEWAEPFYKKESAGKIGGCAKKRGYH